MAEIQIIVTKQGEVLDEYTVLDDEVNTPEELSNKFRDFIEHKYEVLDDN